MAKKTRYWLNRFLSNFLTCMYVMPPSLPSTSMHVYVYMYGKFIYIYIYVKIHTHTSSFYHYLNFRKDSSILNVCPGSPIFFITQTNKLIRHDTRTEGQKPRFWWHHIMTPVKAGRGLMSTFLCTSLEFLPHTWNMDLIQNTQKSLMLFHAN